MSRDTTVGDRLLAWLVGNGWIESRGVDPNCEVRLTAAGVEALRTRLPVG